MGAHGLKRRGSPSAALLSVVTLVAGRVRVAFNWKPTR
jgi:hypothetical protein